MGTEWGALLGRKVSIRYRLYGDPNHPFSEAIGVVMSVSGGRVSILKRAGELVEVSETDILATKVFPA